MFLVKSCNNNYLPQLDGLRALSIILVLLLHAHFQLGKGGAIGVDIFFVLSGFLITNNLMKHDRLSIFLFWTKRAIRLFPTFYLLILFILLIHIFIPKKFLFFEEKELIFASLYLSNIDWFWKFNPEQKILGHTWSLSVEQQFYFIWPIILNLFHRSLKNILTIILFILFVFIISILKNFDVLPFYFKSIFLESIFYGCSICLLKDLGHLDFLDSKLLAWLCISFLVIHGLFNFDFRGILSLDGHKNVIVPLMASILIIHLIVNSDSFLIKLLSFEPLVFVGKISYSLYLWHMPIFRLFKWYSPFTPLISFFLKFLITFLLSFITYYYFEYRLRKYLLKFFNL